MKISFVNGICVRNDAISNAIYDRITWAVSQGHQVRLFAYQCDYDDIPFSAAKDLRDVAFDPFFQQSDIVIFHFGVFYPLFNLLPISPFNAKRVVVFHNVTPAEHIPISERDTVNKSFDQLGNLAFADHIVCDSEFNRLMLSELGIDVPSSVMPLAADCLTTAPISKPSFEDGLTRILFIGRLVESKGPMDLLDAIASVLLENSQVRVFLDVVGNLNFSDPNLLGRVRAKMATLKYGFRGRFDAQLHGNATEKIKAELLSAADMFVLPTRHEGFCVPILEALQTACRVVSYDNSNVPHISGGFATLVTTGEVPLLAEAIAEVIEQTRSQEWIAKGGYTQYRREVDAYCAGFHPDVLRRRFLRFLSHGVAAHPLRCTV